MDLGEIKFFQNIFGRPHIDIHSLSCNKNNEYEFAVGTSFKAMIFDIRQMKIPFTTFVPDLDTSSWKQRQFNVSWSPSGKYIFTHAPILWNFSDDEFPEDGDRPGESISFFWDVHNYERIGMSVDATLLMEWSSGAQTWIDDSLIVGSLSGVHATAPNSRGTENINDPEMDSNDVGPCVVNKLVYNEKTFQLAGVNDENIVIWSHYKLPPRLSSRMQEDDLGMNDLRIDDSESDDF